MFSKKKIHVQLIKAALLSLSEEKQNVGLCNIVWDSVKEIV